ncbi:SixA phosphatase family protein [Tranquillimonas rosea]|uniref:SixA phosphatase family protein n=1 Tax=Tranquillimonas rosea TaxID=641238 RepID=UPI003BAC4987
MTRTLILTRHAKSDWGAPALPDHDRPLNARGQAAAPEIGAWIAARHMPDAALVSSARRAQETWAGLGLTGVEMTTDPSLYLAAPDRLLERLRRAEGACVLMIGHNPGFASFARQMLVTPPVHPSFAKFPTCATLVAAFDVDAWNEIRPGTGRAVDFVVPKDL